MNENLNTMDWSEESWNPTTGCTPISIGCKNCYALPRAKRLQNDGFGSYADGFKLTLHENRFKKPFTIKKPSRIFVDSMSDLFHEDVPLEFIQEVFEIISQNPQHLFLILTKRAELLYEYRNRLPWTNNLIMVVTVEHWSYKNRIDLLRETVAIHKAVFFEPLLSEMGDTDLTGIKWAFVGGESGKNFRPVQKDWILGVKNQCEKQNCTFIFKQWGGNPRWKYGNKLNGNIYFDIPTVENLLTDKQQ